MDRLLRTKFVSLTACIVWGLLCVVSLADERVQAPTATENSDSQIQVWIDQLGSNRFEVREVASEKLENAGDAAITALVGGTKSGSIEQRLRALNILRELAVRDSTGLSPAENAIDDISKAKGTSIANQARGIQDALRQLRSARARQLLVRLGARFGQIEDLDELNVLGSQIIMLTLDKSWRGKPDDLKAINWLPKNVKIRLRGEMFTDEWLAAVFEVKNVVALELNRTGVTDAAMARIGKLTKLRVLQIRYCDKLTDGCLTQIESLSDSLLMLKIFDRQITKRGFDQLVKNYPAWRTRFGRGGFLGVGGIPNPFGRGCMVSRVSPNEAAEKAGLRERDVILTYDGKEVDRFSDRDELDPENPRPETAVLSELIAQNFEGDKIELTVQRPGRETMKIQVTLGAWD